ncbi:MAG: hypothetical protein ACXWUG_04525 [Polyangiales bacterium]
MSDDAHLSPSLAPWPSFRRGAGVLLLGGAAFLVAACSGGSESPTNEETADTEPGDGAVDDTLVDDVAVGDTGGSIDTGAVDTGVTKPDTATVDTGADTKPPGYDYGKTALDESCVATGNFGQFDDVQASADGSKIVFQRCDDAHSIVMRDLAAGTATVIATGTGFFQAGPNGVLGVDAATTELTPWTGGSSVSVPVAITAADAWRVWQKTASLKLANKASGSTSSKEKLVFYTSTSATPVESAEYDVTKSTIASVIFSADGTKVASLERYPSELGSRLRVASPTAGAAVTTYDLALFEPRWIHGGQIGNGALFLSGMNGTQRASRLYYVDFGTGTVKQLSTTDVVPVMPPKDDDVPAVAIVGDKVFFLTGAVSSTGSSPVGKSVTVNVWNVTSPTSSPTTLVTITDAQIYNLAKYTSQKQSIVVSPDKTHLLLNLVAKSGTIFGNAWAAVPVAGGTAKFVAGTSDIAVGAPNQVAASNYMETDTKFVDVVTGTSVGMTRGNPLFSPDGAVYFTTIATSKPDSTYSFTARRKMGTAAESTIVSLSKVDSIPLTIAVQASSLLLRLPRNAPMTGAETKHDLYVFP